MDTIESSAAGKLQGVDDAHVHPCIRRCIVVAQKVERIETRRSHWSQTLDHSVKRTEDPCLTKDFFNTTIFDRYSNLHIII